MPQLHKRNNLNALPELETEYLTGKAETRTLTSRGLLELERQAASGNTLKQAAKAIGISSDRLRRLRMRDPLAKAAWERGMALLRMQPDTATRCKRRSDGETWDVPAAALECVRSLTAKGCGERTIASHLGLTAPQYKNLQDDVPSVKQAADIGFAELEELLAGNLIRMSKNQAIPAIYSSKVLCGWRDNTPAPQTQINNVTLVKLTLPDNMSMDEYTPAMADRLHSEQRAILETRSQELRAQGLLPAHRQAPTANPFMAAPVIPAYAKEAIEKAKHTFNTTSETPKPAEHKPSGPSRDVSCGETER